MSKRKYRSRQHTTTDHLPPAQPMPHKPMSDESVLDHLEIIRVVLAFPDTLMTPIQIRDLIALDSKRERSNTVNQNIHHLCKVGVREGLDPVHGHLSRLDDYEEFHDFLKAGVFYRTEVGVFVLDTAASWSGEWHRNARGIQVRRLRLVDNKWPHHPYKGEPRVIPSNKAKPAHVPPAEKVVESVLEEIDNPQPANTVSIFDQINDGLPLLTEPEEATITVSTSEGTFATGEVVAVGTLPEPTVNGVNPESAQPSGFEVLSLPGGVLLIGSELVLRVNDEIVIVEVAKRYPLAGKS